MNHQPSSKEIIYKGKAFSVERQIVPGEDGRESVFEVVVHPGAVTILPLDSEGRIWFVRQYRYGAGMEVLELPAGTLKTGEDPEAAAKREIREEIGMAAAKMEKLVEFYMAPGYSSEYMYVYLASDLSESPLAQDDDEDLTVEKISAAEAYRMAHSGEIHDGKTLAAMLLAANHPLLTL
jgi:ADP-ribose pyrophosphatase